MRKLLSLFMLLASCNPAYAEEKKEVEKFPSVEGGMFFEVGVGYKLDFMNSWHAQADCLSVPERAAVLLDIEQEICGGRNPTAYFSFGYEFPKCRLPFFKRMDRCRENIGFTHTSHWRDGMPFNDRMEFGLSEVRWWMRIGGAK